MSDVRLNLARKWRAKGFDQIIGQDITVRILKNSLYVGNYFPVYLLWGQRGSGKTSTARVFSAAINCEQLDSFRSNPKTNVVPCLQCASCKAMLLGKHPDFIEIDAASHTGVDNVRQIIDAASLMPLLGRKKIYLIDEAHMLSKAAFNAFLKILEEPPASVLFMLATTDPEKIIDTVKSRCFQLFFKPVVSTRLVDHLETICKAEEIEYEPDALTAIAKESSGSVRDAINLLEQVRFSMAAVTKAAVITSLGYIDDERLLKLFHIIIEQGPTQLLPFLQELNMRLFSAEHLWLRLLTLARAAIWLKHGLNPENYTEQTDQLGAVIQRSSLKKLTKLLERFYSQEPFFLKAIDKHLFLEILLLQACQCNDTTNNSNTTPAAPLAPPSSTESTDEEEYEYVVEEEEEIEEEEDEEEEAASPQLQHRSTGGKAKWNDFVNRIERLDDPLLSSIFRQGTFSGFDESASTITVIFSKDFVFFNEWLDNSYKLWHPLLENVFGPSVVFSPLFTGERSEAKVSAQQVSHDNAGSAQHNELSQRTVQTGSRDSGMNSSKIASRYRVTKNIRAASAVVDVSDVECWKKSNLLLRYFPGVVREAV